MDINIRFPLTRYLICDTRVADWVLGEIETDYECNLPYQSFSRLLTLIPLSEYHTLDIPLTYSSDMGRGNYCRGDPGSIVILSPSGSHPPGHRDRDEV